MLGRRRVLLPAIAVLLAALLAAGSQIHADTPTIPGLTKDAVFTIGSNTAVVDGVAYQMDVAPYIDSNGRTQVPVRYLGDVLGMTATWDAKIQRVTLDEQKFTAEETLTIGSDELYWANGFADGTTVMDTVPVIVPPGRTMLPARWVAQAVGYRVAWDAANQTVTVTPAAGQPGGGGNTSGVGGAGTNYGISSGTNPGPDSLPTAYPPH